MRLNLLLGDPVLTFVRALSELSGTCILFLGQ